MTSLRVAAFQRYPVSDNIEEIISREQIHTPIVALHETALRVLKRAFTSASSLKQMSLRSDQAV